MVFLPKNRDFLGNLPEKMVDFAHGSCYTMQWFVNKYYYFIGVANEN